jgi:hypothetical protein
MTPMDIGSCSVVRLRAVLYKVLSLKSSSIGVRLNLRCPRRGWYILEVNGDLLGSGSEWYRKEWDRLPRQDAQLNRNLGSAQLARRLFTGTRLTTVGLALRTFQISKHHVGGCLSDDEPNHAFGAVLTYGVAGNILL